MKAFLLPFCAASMVLASGAMACALTLPGGPSAHLVPLASVPDPGDGDGAQAGSAGLEARAVRERAPSSLQMRRVSVDTATEGCLKFSDDTGTYALPLLDTRIQADISGTVAVVEVTQLFHNPSSQPIEAIYSLPLPDDGAVDDMTIAIGDRVIQAEIRRRAEARQLFEAARDNGQTAALLEQERANIFTQSVANILPQETVEVVVSVVAPLHYEDGRYTWHFPMTIGPRFNPDSKSVPDASNVTPPLAVAGRSGHDIHLEVDLHTAVPIESLESTTHEVSIQPLNGERTFIELASHETIPNRDFELTWEVAGYEPATGLMSHTEGQDSWFSLMIEPPAEWSGEIVVPKEMVFVIDASCSMSGEPMAKAKALVRHAVQHMNPGDTFQIIRFSEAASALGRQPLANTPANVERGLRYIDSLHGSGGTQMIEGIRAALDYPSDPHRLRQVLFLTDGYIGNEVQILDAIEQRLGDTRLFSLGLGSSPNRYLLERMARSGRGTVQYALPQEDEKEVVEVFYERIRNPLLRNIELDWGSLRVDDVTPALIPDLYAGQPIQVWGRTTNTGRATVTLRAQLGRADIEMEVDIDLRQGETNPGIRSMWARRQIEDRMALMLRGPEPGLQEEVVQLSLKHRVMSQWTSFVAIDDEVRTRGNAQTMHIANELADGTSMDLGPQTMRSRSSMPVPASGLILGAPGRVDAVGGLSSRGRGRGLGAVGYGRGGGGIASSSIEPPAAAQRSPMAESSAEAEVAEADDVDRISLAQGPAGITLVSMTFGDEGDRRELSRRLRRFESRLNRADLPLGLAGRTLVFEVSYDSEGTVQVSLGRGSPAEAESVLALIRRSGLLDLSIASQQGSLTLQF